MSDIIKGKVKVQFSHINSNGDNIYMVVDESESTIDFSYLFKKEASDIAQRWNSQPDLLAACKALMETPTSLPPDNQFDIEQRKYRNACMNKIAVARKLAKAAIAKAES